MSLIRAKDICKKMGVNYSSYQVALKSNVKSVFIDGKRYYNERQAKEYVIGHELLKRPPAGTGWMTKKEFVIKYGLKAGNRIDLCMNKYNLNLKKHGIKNYVIWYKQEEIEFIGNVDLEKWYRLEFAGKILGISAGACRKRCERLGIYVKNNSIQGENVPVFLKNALLTNNGKKYKKKLKQKHNNYDPLGIMDRIKKKIVAKGNVINVTTGNDFIFVPESGVGCYECKLIIKPPLDLYDIIAIEGGYVANFSGLFYVTGYKQAKIGVCNE